MKSRIHDWLQSPGVYLTLILVFILALGMGLRLFDLTDQPIDFHPTRQLRGAIVARGMYYELSPTVDQAARQRAIASWRSTGQYEPSILERIVSIIYLIIGQEVMWVARIINSLFWIIGGVALFALARQMSLNALAKKAINHNEIIASGSALLALAYYLTLPFGVQASRSFQPDPGMVMWFILSIYAVYRWSDQQEWKWAILSGVFAGIAVLTKAVAVYIVAGAIAGILLHTFVPRYKLTPACIVKILSNPKVWSIVVLTIAPATIYYLSQSDRASEYFSTWTVALSHLLLQPTTYLRWLNLVQQLMGPIALLIALGGVILSRGRNLALLIGLWTGYILYGLFLPYQMYTHNYYHLQLIPIIALSMTTAFRFILERVLGLSKGWHIALSGLVIIWLLYFSWVALIPLYGQDYRGEPAYWQEIASYLPDDGKIIALTQDYGYRLMYYGWRKVTLWPNRGEQKLNKLRGDEKEFLNLFEKRIKDKRYFLITAFKQFDDQPTLQQTLYDNYPILAEGQGYIIFDLAGP